MSEEKRICEEKGCKQEGFYCHLSYYDDVKEETVDQGNYYCAEHASLNGYCWGCGEFQAGCENFDSEPSGLCPNCRDDPDLTGDYPEEELKGSGHLLLQSGEDIEKGIYEYFELTLYRILGIHMDQIFDKILLPLKMLGIPRVLHPSVCM